MSKPGFVVAGRGCRAGSVAALVAASITIGAIGQASAGDDAGIHAFFSQPGGAPEASDRSEPVGAQPTMWPAPALTIRARPHQDSVRRSSSREALRRSFAHRVVVANVSGATPGPDADAATTAKPIRVSIMEDRTLRRGDAVMTKEGLRIFLGSRSFPYQASDFRAIGDGAGISEQYRKALTDIDQLPPSAG